MKLLKKRNTKEKLLKKYEKEGFDNLTEEQICKLLEIGTISLNDVPMSMFKKNMIIAYFKNIYAIPAHILTFKDFLLDEDVIEILNILKHNYYFLSSSNYFCFIEICISNNIFLENGIIQDNILNLEILPFDTICSETSIIEYSLKDYNFFKKLLPRLKECNFDIFEHLNDKIDISEIETHFLYLIISEYPFKYVIDYIPDEVLPNLDKKLKECLSEKLSKVKEYNVRTFNIIKEYFYGIIDFEKVRKLIQKLNGDFSEFNVSSFDPNTCSIIVECDPFDLSKIPEVHKKSSCYLYLHAFSNLQEKHLKDKYNLRNFLFQFPIGIVNDILEYYDDISNNNYTIKSIKEKEKDLLDDVLNILKDIQNL